MTWRRTLNTLRTSVKRSKWWEVVKALCPSRDEEDYISKYVSIKDTITVLKSRLLGSRALVEPIVGY